MNSSMCMFFLYHPNCKHLISLSMKEKNDVYIIKKYKSSSYISNRFNKILNNFYFKVGFLLFSGFTYGILSTVIDHFIHKSLDISGISQYLYNKFK